MGAESPKGGCKRPKIGWAQNGLWAHPLLRRDYQTGWMVASKRFGTVFPDFMASFAHFGDSCEPKTSYGGPKIGSAMAQNIPRAFFMS